MKNKILFLFLIAGVLLFESCANLDLEPLAGASTEEWYSSEEEINLSLNDLYREYVWSLEAAYATEKMTDNWSSRQDMNTFPAGTITSEWSVAGIQWLYFYKGIARCNNILDNLDRLASVISEENQLKYAAEARFMRACIYSKLIFYWGDVPYLEGEITIEEAFKMGRTSKAKILPKVYEDFDFSTSNLPVSYSGSDNKRATKGAAYAFKARIALYMEDYELAQAAAKSCMDLNIYQLNPDFGTYFLSTTKNDPETIFAIPRSAKFAMQINVNEFIPRNNGGNAVSQPSWDLFFAFLCKDGLPVDKSTLYNPKKPFDNRDPRLAETIAPFGEEFLDYMYDPTAAKIKNVSTNQEVDNKDNRAVDQYASFNGLLLKKGVDQDWVDDKVTDPDIIAMRYADILLMYAEAKIELNQIDQSVVDALNSVRARAYGVDKSDVDKYPAFEIVGQEALRKQLRMERRMELAWENRRFDDLIRWKLAEKALTRPNYGLLDPAALKEKVVDAGNWFLPETPVIDEDGLVNFEKLAQDGWIKVLAIRNFDASRQYLWPIPAKEVTINENMKQNPNY